MSDRRFHVIRLDKGELTSQGFMRFPASFTRVGVFNYRKEDGTIIRELRHPDDVFKPESMASLQMAPVTDNHPAEFVSPKNIKKHSVGWVSETIRKGDNSLDGIVTVADENALANVSRGKVELSCGYGATLIPETGIYDGEPYEFRQTDIVYNHVAIVERGRMGPRQRLRTDSADAEIVDENEGDLPEMKTLKIGDKEFQVSQEIYDAFMLDVKTRQDLAEKAKSETVSKADSDKAIAAMKSANDVLQARLDTAEEKLKNPIVQKLDTAEIQKIIKERAKLEKTAFLVLGDDAKIEDKADLDVMKTVIAKEFPSTDLTGKSEDYIRARFDGIAEGAGARESRRFQLVKNDSTEKVEDSETARTKSMDADKAAWKQPLAFTKK